MKTRYSILVGLIAGAICSSAKAQDNSDKHSCVASGTGAAIDDTAKCISKSQLLGALDLSVPESPLFTLMGATPESVIKPKTGDEIMFSFLPQAFDAFGGNDIAFAMEINPGLLMLPDRISPIQLSGGNEGAQSLNMERLLSMFTLSGAYSRSVDGDDQSQYGLGINFNFDTKSALINNGDYRKCIGESQDKIEKLANQFFHTTDSVRVLLNEIGIPVNKRTSILIALDGLQEHNIKTIKNALEADNLQLSADQINILVPRLVSIYKMEEPDFVDRFDTIVTDCVGRVTEWNRDVYSAGAAFYHTDVVQSDPMANTALMPDPLDDVNGYGFWGTASFRSPIKGKGGKSHGQFTFHARYTDNLVRERGSGDDAVKELVDAWSVAGRYTHQFGASKNQASKKAQAFRGFVEASYVEEEFSGIKDEYWQAGIGAEIQLRKNLFVQLVVGDTFGSEIDRSTYMSSQIKWAFSKASAN